MNERRLQGGTISRTPKLPRGFRNNNPGNIKWVESVKWLGQELSTKDGPFCQFKSMEWGVRALAVLLRNYQRKYGIRTVRAIIERFAPGCENPTSAYIATVAKMMDVDPDAVLDLERWHRMEALVDAICFFENALPIPQDVLHRGMELAGFEKGT